MGIYASAAEVRKWANITAPDDEIDPVLDAVEAALAQTHNLPEPPPFGEVPADLRLGIIMQTARVWKRRTTPEGIVQFGSEFVVRVTRFDSDIETLLAPYIHYAIGTTETTS